MKKNYKLAIFYTVLTVGIILSLWLMFRSINTADSIVYSDLVEMFTNKEVKSFEVDKNNRVVIATERSRNTNTSRSPSHRGGQRLFRPLRSWS